MTTLSLPPEPAPKEEGPAIPVYSPAVPATSGNPLGEYAKHQEKNPDEKRVLLFTIGGTPFYRPKEVQPNVGFKFLRDVRKHGRDYAVAELIVNMLGEKCLDALADANLSKAEWDIIEKVMKEDVLGAVDETAGKD